MEERTRMRTLTRTVTAVWIVLACTATAHAQSVPTTSEDIEPRVIGTTGTMLVGLSGYLDEFFSSERRLPLNYSAQVDVGRFLTKAFVVRGGLRGSGSVGGDASEDLAAGSGAPALHAFAGLLHYLTAQSLVSVYAGAEYWAQLTQRRSPDAGSVVGTLGVQGALSSR